MMDGKEKPVCVIYIYVDKIIASVDLASKLYQRINSIIVNYSQAQGYEITSSYIDVDSDVRRQELITKLKDENDKPDIIFVYGDTYGLDQFDVPVFDVLTTRG